MSPEAEEVFDKIPALAGPHRVVADLPGGLTNRNYTVTTDDGAFVARCTRSDSVLLQIDRVAEFHNTVSAARSGVGAPFVDYRPDLNILVIGYVDGRTCTAEDLREPGMIARTMSILRSLHSGPSFVGEFDMFERQAGYLRTCRENDFAIPADYERWHDDFVRAQHALAALPEGPVPCHNDLLAGNIIDTVDRLWLIDYEYSGNGDPYFDLGNCWTECGLDEEHLVEMVTAYVGHEDPQLVARARVQATVSRYGWALWGFIQAASMEDEFDFHGWGTERFELAVADFEDARFGQWLDRCAGWA